MMLICGCVVDADTVKHAEPERAGYCIIECPFCGVTFTLDDLETWSRENFEEIRNFLYNAFNQVRPLIQYKKQAYEVVSICGGCGYPIVCKMGGDSRRPKHLRVPVEDTVRLFD